MEKPLGLIVKNLENIEGILEILKAHRKLINSLIEVNKIQQTNVDNLLDIFKLSNRKNPGK